MFKLSLHGGKLHYLSTVKHKVFFGLYTLKPKWLPVYIGWGSKHRDTPVLAHQVDNYPSFLLGCLNFSLRTNGELNSNA